MDYKKGKILGNIWEFYPLEERTAIDILNFALDTGMGEKNSAGFGFLNIKRDIIRDVIKSNSPHKSQSNLQFTDLPKT